LSVLAAVQQSLKRGLPTWQLFALAVLVWGTTWHAIVYQIAETPVVWSVALRFALAGACCAVVAALRHEALWLGWRGLALAAFQGLFMYSLSYLCVYEAEHHVPSGLVAIGYSLSPILNGVASHLIWKTPLTPRLLLGGVMGAAGVVLIFAPEMARVDAKGHTGLGLLFTVAAVLLSSVGSLASSRNRSLGLPFWSTMAWGMGAGALLSTALALAQGVTMPWPLSGAWWASFLYLSLAGSTVAFACFLGLQQRLGPGPASTVGVATPVLALIVSAVLEGYVPTLWTLAGVGLAAGGSALALGLKRLQSKAQN
jgi:drug/metabolite transporter (DMT)-like permease